MRSKGKKCVAAKGAKISSWLLPQSGYKWVEVIQHLYKTSYGVLAKLIILKREGMYE